MTGNPQSPSNNGFGFATFLLGDVDTGSMIIGIGTTNSRKYFAEFVQDDFKVTHRLTLNVGFRYDIDSSPVERFDRYSSFNPGTINSLTNTPGVMQFADSSFGRSVYPTQFTNLGPRFGFGWDIFGNSKTVMRGGYGIFYYDGANFQFPGTDGFARTLPQIGHPPRARIRLSN